MNGILLGTCETEKETIEFLLETDASNLNDSGISLGKIGGMVLLTDSGNFFATEWDDQPVRPDNFVEMKSADDASQAHGIPGRKFLLIRIPFQSHLSLNKVQMTHWNLKFPLNRFFPFSQKIL